MEKTTFCTELHLQAQFGLDGWARLRAAPKDDRWFWRSYQAAMDMVTASARIAKIFEPGPRKDAKLKSETLARGEGLRELFSSVWGKLTILRSKAVRNSVEHFDERLDAFIHRPEPNKIHFDMIPPGMFGTSALPANGKALRHIDADSWIFHVYEDAVPLVPLSNELLLLETEAKAIGQLW